MVIKVQMQEKSKKSTLVSAVHLDTDRPREGSHRQVVYNSKAAEEPQQAGKRLGFTMFSPIIWGSCP